MFDVNFRPPNRSTFLSEDFYWGEPPVIQIDGYLEGSTIEIGLRSGNGTGYGLSGLRKHSNNEHGINGSSYYFDQIEARRLDSDDWLSSYLTWSRGSFRIVSIFGMDY